MTSFHAVSLAPVIRGMRNAAAILQKGLNHAKANNIDPQDYLSGRLHPDMAALPSQIWRLTDTAKAMVPRINPSLEPLSLPDVETTFPELQARIKRTIEYLEAVKVEDIDGRENADVIVKLPGSDGNLRELPFTGSTYVVNFAHPNFWFHVTTLYGILRMKGVDLGKQDYMNGAQRIKVEE